MLIAMCDTFHAGAIDQLHMHWRHLNALHPGMVHLYEQGYGKDVAASAAQAIIEGQLCPTITVLLTDSLHRFSKCQWLQRVAD